MKSLLPLRPQLFTTYYDWFVNNDLKTHIIVNSVFPGVVIPKECAESIGKDQTIVFNITPVSIGDYSKDSEGISFKIRVQGKICNVYVPFGALLYIFNPVENIGFPFPLEQCYVEVETSKQEKVEENKDKKSLLKIIE